MRVVKRDLGDEALVHQGFVGFPLALRDVELRFGCLGLLACLLPAVLVFHRVNACQDLSGFDAVAFADCKFFDFTRYSRFDGREVDRLDRARDRQALHQLARFGADHIGGRQFNFVLNLCGGRCRLRLMALDHHGAHYATHEPKDKQADQDPSGLFFHD